MTDYTLPPFGGWIASPEEIEDYGRQCAEAARAPLLERIAELEAQNKLLSDDLDATEAERKRLLANIAELEAERDIDIRALLNVCRVYMASDEMPPEVQAKQALAAAERIRAQIRARRIKENGDA